MPRYAPDMTACRGERRNRRPIDPASVRERSLHEVISALVHMLEARDTYTGGHMSRVADLAGRIARRMRMPAEVIEAVRIAGQLHDIGKNGLPNGLLTQREPLSPEQRRLIEEHVAIGVRVLRDIDFPWPVREAVAQHHERLDGSGYPRGLRDGAITREARILAVADTIEAMLHARPYRAAFGRKAVETALLDGRGKAFDASVVDAALAMLHDPSESIDADGRGAEVGATIR